MDILKKTALVLIPIIAVVLFFYFNIQGVEKDSSSSSEREALRVWSQKITDIDTELIGQRKYQEAYDAYKAMQVETTDPILRSRLALAMAGAQKRIDLDAGMREYASIVRDQANSTQMRGLALLKISQQANGLNRYDVLDPFLTEEEKKLPDFEKNYIVNKQIYALYPLAMVYIDIRLYEYQNGAVVDVPQLQADVDMRVKKDIANKNTLLGMRHLVPDTLMHEAMFFTLLDEKERPDGIKSADVIALYQSALKPENFVLPHNPTKDYVLLGYIDYLLKIGNIEEANMQTDIFLQSDQSDMILIFIKNNGLKTRYHYIERNTNVREKIIAAQ